MKKASLCAVLLWVATAHAAAPAAFAKARERFEQVVPFEPGGRFRLQNANGSIEVQTWNEANVRIEAEKVAETEERLRDIEIAVEGSGDRVSVRTIHHHRRGGGHVSYRISLPTDAEVDVETANGAVSIRGIRGRVSAGSVNGSLKIEELSGEIDASTTNGSIHASYDQPGEGRHRFSTTNGSVRIYLPPDAGGDFEAETVNGSIELDFPVTVNRMTRRHMRGSFGTGGGSFDIETVNGSIKILSN